MDRCKFCGEVLEYNSKFCPVCGKDTSKEPSERFLKKKEKKDAFKVNHDARNFKISNIIFGCLFITLPLILMIFYGQYVFKGFGLDNVANNYEKAINKVFEINKTVNEILPYENLSGGVAVSFLLIFYFAAMALTIGSLFTKKTSLGAIMYKSSALLSLLFLVFVQVMKCFAPTTDLSSVMDILCYVIGGISLLAFLIGFICAFNFKNPYRATWYQGVKALFVSLTVLLGAFSTDLQAILTGSVLVYTFVAGILLFIGIKYRGDIKRLV